MTVVMTQRWGKKRDKFMSESPPLLALGDGWSRSAAEVMRVNRLTWRSSWKFAASFDLVSVPGPRNGRGGGGELKDKQIRWWEICISMVSCRSVVDGGHNKTHESAAFMRTKPGHGYAEIRKRSQSRWEAAESGFGVKGKAGWNTLNMFISKYVWCV